MWRDEGTTQDTYGAAVEDWKLQGSRWGNIMPGRGAERFAQDSERASQAVTITIRYDELTVTLGPKDRLRYQTSEYDVQSVGDVDTAHRYIDVLCLLRSPEADRLP